jgi:hypothetical protein
MSNGERGDGSSGARVVHVQRIFQDDDPQSNIWVDVERIDELHLIIAGTQRVHYIFNWDVLESDQYSGPKKTIVDPNDENSKIDIPVREVVHVVGPKGKVAHQFLNGAGNLSRETHSRRIYHHEIKDSYLVEGKPPRDPKDYLNSLGDQDKDQFIDVEIIDAYITNGFDKDDVHGFSQILADGVPKDSKARTQRKVWQGTTDDPFMNEPLLESDEEGGAPGFIFLRNPDAGPTIDPPWRLDPLQNIVNVSWAVAGIFVSGAARYSDIDQIARYLKATGPEEDFEWENFGLGVFGGAGEAYGAAYGKVGADKDGKGGKDTFVMVGARNSGTASKQGMIMASFDGKSWQQVYSGLDPESSDISTGSSVFAVVWDGKQFWAGAHESENGLTTAEVNEIDILLSSLDGLSWSEVGRTVINFTEWPAGYNPGLLVAHCSDKVNDDRGNPVPSGIYAEKKTGENSSILIQPTTVQSIDYLFGVISTGEYESSIKRIETTQDGKQEKTIDIGFPVTCIANAGDVWVAGGGEFADGENARSAYSLDDGKTWKNLDVTGKSAFLIGMAGKKKDPQAAN